MSNLTITDNLGTAAVTVDTTEIVEALTAWFTDTPAEITAAIEDLQRAAMRGEWVKVTDLAIYLEVTVTR